jgi:L-alanine-DL-glutamate epimerase-like enolase superfamily enzyme
VEWMASIVKVEGWRLGIKLKRPVVLPSMTYDERDYAVVRLTDADGATGFAYGMSRSAPLIETVKALAPIVLGRDPWQTRGTWDALYAASIPYGQRGLALRAISLIDVAGWDLKARICGRPLHELMGSTRRSVPLSVGGGYYREHRPPDDVAAELRGYVDAGFKMIKIPAGGLSPAAEEKWVGAARAAIGNEAGLAVDTHWTWQTVESARQVLRRFEQFDLGWAEDPLWPEAIGEIAELGRLVAVPLGIGDELSGRWAYRDLAEARAAALWRVDAMTVGGITEFLRVLSLAETYGVPVSTHIYPEIHVHCAAASATVTWTEYVAPEADIDLSYRFIGRPLIPSGGEAVVPDGPGLGIELDWDLIVRTSTQSFSVGN